MNKNKTAAHKNKNIQKFKEQYFDFYDDIKHQTKNKDIEW